MNKVCRIVIAIFLYLINYANAGVFDNFKDPSELIMNQKNCWFYSEYRQGQMIDGKFVFNNYKIFAEFKKLDKNKVFFKKLWNLDPGETPPETILTVHRDGKRLSAFSPNGNIILNCTL